MPGPIRRLVHVLASVAVLSLALVFVESTAANAQGIDSNEDLHSVSCASVNFCVAVDERGNAVTYNGSTWSAPLDVDGSVGFLYSVSCPSSNFCAAVGDGHVVTYNGSTWSTPLALVSGSSSPPTAVSCPSANFCVAAIESGTAIYNGSSWSATPGGIAGFESVSCPSANFCAAVGNGGGADTYNGSSWSAPVNLGIASLDSVSCPSANFCAAVGEGDVAIYNGSSWSAPSDVDTDIFISSVSCPSANFCVAVDEGGGVLTYNGSSWSAPVNVGGVGGLLSVSCASANFCVAIDGDFAFIYPSTSVIIPSTGASLSGSTDLDASATNATSVEFKLFGGIYGYSAPVICTATATEYGWLCPWNTTTVPNGSYTLLSEAFNSFGSAFSSGVGITVSNPPTTSVLIPSNGAKLSGSTYLDASASNATSVEFWILGGSYGYTGKMIGKATASEYGWLDDWNTTTVPDGSYVLVSEAFNTGGSAFSSGVSITVKN